MTCSGATPLKCSLSYFFFLFRTGHQEKDAKYLASYISYFLDDNILVGLGEKSELE